MKRKEANRQEGRRERTRKGARTASASPVVDADEADDGDVGWRIYKHKYEVRVGRKVLGDAEDR
jgi:hypothetical protein